MRTPLEDLYNPSALDDGYTYDPAGNRLTKSSLGGNSSCVYDENDRLKSDGKYTYGWDESGNLTSRTGPEGSTTYKYDPDNRMIEASGPNGTVQFAYDAQGNRISRTTAPGVTTFVVDPNMPYVQVLEENGPGGAKVYAYGNDMLNLQGPEGTRWFAYDGLGSTRALTDSSGTLTDAYTYEAFGTVVHRTGTSANDFQFTGEQYESGLDMYYLRARYYEPGTGRFGATDTYSGNRYSPVTLNKFLYADANPASYIDPSGHMALATLMNEVALRIQVGLTMFAIAHPVLAKIMVFVLESLIPTEVQMGIPNLSVAEGLGISGVLAASKELVNMKRLFNKLGGFCGLGNTFENWVGRLLKADIKQRIVKDGVEIGSKVAGSAVIDFIITRARAILEVKLSGSAIKMNQAKQIALYAKQEGLDLVYVFFKRPTIEEAKMLKKWVDEATDGTVEVIFNHLFN